MPRDDIALSDLGTAADGVQSAAHKDESVTETNIIPFRLPDENRLDHFIKRDGETFAGSHLIVDLWDASGLDDIAHIESVLKRCVEVAGATLLHFHLHRFSPEGVSGVAVLAESHISIHTWPEVGYAALDIFMCGDAEPHKAIRVLEEGFRAGRVELNDLKRGRVAAR
ncbi:adenosylmethionine decarboxylase [Marivibrio halodurans]|uniref:S-adenosylmethionine decarboxylase proenzyme n=1 Tax=Marivibrio halodurans TaxID=2039722 RepID=A0A8J7V458_9PROT|nr:adenosylmethionine decarboxylase [Marivibrio halodurans]MBP5859080.1 adenosylmethionine decarboxylase [Marivibrio halodurans]